MNYTNEEKSKVKYEIQNIYKKLSNNNLNELQSYINNLEPLIEGIPFGSASCKKMRSITNEVDYTKNQTVTLCNKIINVINT